MGNPVELGHTASTSFVDLTVDAKYRYLYVFGKTSTNVLEPMLVPVSIAKSLPNIGFSTQYDLGGNNVVSAVKYISGNAFQMASTGGGVGVVTYVYGIE